RFYVVYAADFLYPFSVVTVPAELLYVRQRDACIVELVPTRDELKGGGRDSVLFEKLLLKPLILNEPDDPGLRVYDYSFLLQLLQRIHVDFLDFDRNHVELLPK